MEIHGYTIDETKIAPAVTQRLLGRAISHILSNECSANVLNWSKREIVGKDGKPDSVTESMLDAWRQSHTDAIAAREAAFCEAKIAAMYDGTLSVRVARGPVRDPVEAAMRAIAKVEVTAVLKANGAKFPKADETVVIGDQEVDGDTLVDRRLAHAEHGPRIRGLAERKVREDARLRDATAKATAGEMGLGGLGL